MCHDPHTLADGTVVACRKCELCRYNRVKDWAGRNIAQSKVSAASFACTLTYGPELDGDLMPIPGRTDHIRASVLTYSDPQKFLKYLRWLGYAVDYFITGEMGGERGRSHWHIILHFRGRVPTHELKTRFSDRHRNEKGQLFQHEVCKAWPHGFMYWEKATFEDVFYNCKYILKDEDDEAAQRKPGMSKKPPIGTEYFLRWADTHVEKHVAPQTLEYRFPEIKKKDGTPLIFYLKGRTAELFLERFISRWREVHGDKPRPRSDLVDLFEKYGKVVTDEARMLLRQEFPKGESRAVIPTSQQIKAMAEEVIAEREERMREMAAEAKNTWQHQWVKDAKDGTERERRQGVVQFEQFVDEQNKLQLWKEFEQFKAKFGWSFVVGKGWIRDGSGPGSAGSETYLQWRRKRAAMGRGTVDSDDAGNRQDTEPLGPVGTFNKHYSHSHRPHKAQT